MSRNQQVFKDGILMVIFKSSLFVIYIKTIFHFVFQTGDTLSYFEFVMWDEHDLLTNLNNMSCLGDKWNLKM